MTRKEQFHAVMKGCFHIALATSVANQPNVRLVSFGYDEGKQGRLFFATFKENQKVVEIEKNPQVACTCIPAGPDMTAQVRIFGKAQKSSCSLQEVIEIMRQKNPEDAQTLAQGGDMLQVYEICFSEAWVTVGMNPAERCQIARS